ncbi:phenylalanine--tRNA ligase subunit beta [Bacteroidia bacterium]|nr:phenylalanine--tRNA ligase subunit beta [Bacteroidia bacterium]MDB9882207.1 phenylalanine--tRNA ligase subunit beta [Bacteroidia bacterium]
MKISYNWLKRFINIDLPLEEICEKLTMSGLEVEHILKTESIKGGLKKLVVGQVLTKEKHPNADKLNKTTVDIGNGTILDIVCGAANVAAGQKVVVAPVGTTINMDDGSFEIKKSKIRGEVSEGMICAEDEIGLGSSHDGIMILDDALAPGTPLNDIYEVETDHQIEIAIIPNRGDAISHMGVARELQALTGAKYKKPSLESIDARGQMRVDVAIDDIKAAPRYSGITLTGVSIAESPNWLKKRLQSIDLKPINNVVDVTNFIQYEIGQPLHAFDYAKIGGHKIVARFAKEGETLTTLDEVERKLTSDHLLICDANKPLALAGVLGGHESGVSDNTTSIFIESAYFNPAAVRKTAKSFGLNTDSSYRFERGTDPEMVNFALIRAVNLIQEIAGGEIASEVVDVYPEAIEPLQVEIKLEELNKFIGHEIPEEVATKILNSLEIKILAHNNQNLNLEVPRYRPDVERPVDIYEEILRVYGFDNIPIPQKVNYIPSVIAKNTPNKIKSKISNYLSDIGFNEIMNNSLVASKYYTEDELAEAVHMLNPLSQDMNVMRLELVNSALTAVAYNVNRKNSNLKFYEFGKTYFKIDGKYSEKEVLQLTFSGNRHPEHWSTKAAKANEDELKAVAANILVKLNIAPKQLERITQISSVSKAQMKTHGLKQECVTLAIDWDACIQMASDKVSLKEIPVFPIVRRDLSLVLDKAVTYAEVQKITKQTLQQNLTDILLFDVYEGKPLEADQKSFSVAYFLYNPKKTMEDVEIDGLMAKLIANFETKLKAIIRK